MKAAAMRAIGEPLRIENIEVDGPGLRAGWTVRLIYETLARDHHHPGLSPRARRIPDGRAG
jgi:hypothetical protein